MSTENGLVISIIVPCYNEEGNIEVLYQKIKDTLEHNTVEFVFIDDNSSDETLYTIEKLAEQDANVKYVSFSRNFGHQNALRAGLENAAGNCVISMDADLQHPPEILNTLLDKWYEGYDIVYTQRQDSNHKLSIKAMTSSLFYKFMNYFSEVEIKQGLADFRLIDRKIVNILINDITEYHLFYRGLISWLGFKQIGVEYVPNVRYSGKTKYTLRKMLSFATDGITSFSAKPLKFAVLIGVFISFIAVIYAFYILYVSLFTDNVVEGWTSVILSVLFIGGVNMILLGIIGEYIGKIFIQMKRRPYYLIKKTNIER